MDCLTLLLSQMNQMERNIVNSIDNLSYITKSSFEELNSSVTEQLKAVNSSLDLNNLLTGIQAYQSYRINQNTKSLRQ